MSENKIKKPIPPVIYFEVEEGLHNPRDPRNCGWRGWSQHATLKEARIEAHKLQLYRIRKVQVIEERNSA